MSLTAEPIAEAANPPGAQDLAELRQRHGAQSIGRTVLALLSAQSLGWVSSIVGLVMVPRFLGPQDFGLFATALGISAFISTIAAFGTNLHIIKGSAREPEMAASLFVHSVVLRTGIWSLLAVPLIPASFLFIQHPSGPAVVLLTAGATLLFLVTEASIAGLQANHMVGRPALFRALALTVSQCVTALVLVLGNGVLSVAIVHVATAGATAIGVTALFWRRFGRPVRLSRADLRAMAIAGRPYLSWDLSLAIYGRADQLMLATMVGTAAVGLYAFAYRLVAIPALLPAIVSSAVYPALAATAHRDEPHFRSVLAGALRLVVVGSTPAAVGLVILGGDLTRLLAGADFKGTEPILILLAIHMPFVGVDSIIVSGMIALDRQSFWARVGWAAAVFNPALNVLAISVAASLWSNGAIGAAFATLVTEVLMTAAATYLMRRHIEAELGAIVLRVVVACLLMGAVVIVIHGTVGLWGAIAAGALTYGLLAIPLRLLRSSDVALVRGTVVSSLRKPAEAAVPA